MTRSRGRIANRRPAGAHREACPTPHKFPIWDRRVGLRNLKVAIRARNLASEVMPPMFIYRCMCGAEHLTHHSEWWDVPLELFYAVDEDLQRWAFPLETPSGSLDP